MSDMVTVKKIFLKMKLWKSKQAGAEKDGSKYEEEEIRVIQRQKLLMP